MKSRYWFLLSVILFIAAAFFWHLGEEKRASQQRAKTAPEKISSATAKQTASTGSTSVAPAASAKKLLANPPTNSATANSTNAPALYPHRLKNTSQTMDQLVRNDRAILLRNALIDTSAEGVKIPDNLRSKGNPGSYIVQARGAADASFHAALMEAKAEIISYVPNNAYLVRLPNGLAKLAHNKQVQSVLPYEPYYKLDTDLLAMAMDNKPLPRGKMVRVGLFPGQRDAAVEALKGKAQIVGEDLKSSPFGPELIVASADLIQLANLPQVQEIEPFYEREVLNDLTRVRLGVSTDSVTTTNFLNLTGSNIWVNVNDTTIDNGHPDLSPRIFPAAGVGIVDPEGHGTHVAGIIASSGANGPGDSVTNVGSVVGANFRGKAPSASILSQDIFAGLSDAELQITAAETNFLELNRQSPLISNNSWGYGTRAYNSSAASFDAAVRDALPGSIGSQPIAYVFSAGNSGDGPGSIISPATAKNVISVGALKSKRDITNDVVRPDANCNIVTNKEFLGLTDSSNEVAGFSSRGNVGISQEGTFGRLKPDVVAPGTFIASTRSQQFDEASYYSPLHVDRNVFPNLVIDPVATNNFAIFIPDDPCDEGATLNLTIDAIITSAVPADSSLLIYAGPNPNPSSVPGNLLGANSVLIDRANLPLNDILYYDIVNTNDLEIIYNLQTSLVLSNDFGQTTNGFFQVLSNLNGYLAPNYMFESGTSMSAPAVSGMLALMQEFFEERFQITNTPAMMKALLINGSRAIGSGYNKEASLNNAGWGLPDLRRILPTNTDSNTWPVQLFDQSTNFALATGERHDRVVTMNDTNSPLRITLVWTDPPGNPAVGVKLVNDLDLVVTTVLTNGLDTNGAPVVSTNVYFGNNFPGGEFTQPSVLGTNGLSEFDAVRDSVNNVENVYINGPLGGQYTVSVVAHRVNVNAVTAHTNGIVQDYALVISADTGTNAPFTVDTNTIVGVPNTNAFVTIITNTFPTNSYGALLSKQRVGANSPLLNLKTNNLTDGMTNQWAFYVLSNAYAYTNVAFLTFLPPNLSGASNTVPGSRRIIEADIDMYVSTDSTLTNLNPAAIAAADKSLKRGGQELIVYTNRNDPIFYVGIKSEDQRASEFSFFAIASASPFSQEQNGNIIVYGIPSGGVDVPDGSPDNPGGAPYIMIAATDAKVGRVVVTNQITHERIGDLIGTLTHEGSGGENSVALINHSFPDGQETGTFTGIYDDSGLDEGDIVPGSRPTDGPGSLLDFVGTEAAGAWILTTEDNSLNSTGRVDFTSLFIERALDTNDLAGGNGFTISGGIPPNRSRALSFVVPLNATNMIIELAPKEGALDTVVRRGRLAPTRNPYVDKGALISPPGAQLTVNTNDAPPLRPGRYVLRLFNDNGVFVNFSGSIRFELDLTAASQQTYSSSGATLIDDAVTNSIIHVDRSGLVVSTEVSVRIDHPRVSDLVLHLVSPQGTRVLLAENRGGLSTNGYGFSNLQTNVFPTTSAGDANADTNILGPTLTSGILNIDYDFFNVPDQLRVYYDGVRIFDSGLVSDSGRFTVPFGPGVDTNIVIVMNEGGNPDPSTAWNYTATVLSGDFVYATFSENTNLALVPIKFAIPPFATNVPGSNANTFMSSYFEDPTVAGTYAAPGTVDGWTVKTNSVDVISSANAHRGTNFLELAGGAGAPSGADILAGPILNPANGHYYYLLVSNTWTASEARAVTLGGHLVTINDASEDNWVYTTFGSYGGTSRALWIGLNDSAQEGNFVWASGQTAPYRNWVPGEPNHYDAGEDYVLIFQPGEPSGRAGKWNDYNNLSGVIEFSPTVPLNGVVELDSVAGTAGITRTLPTVAGEFYNLKFAYRRSQPATLSSANITLDGIFTNEFVGNPSWIVHSTSFVAPKNGTKLDIDGLASSGGSGSSQNLLTNGSFEQGFTGWTRNNSANVVIITNYPPSDGTNCVTIGAYDVPGCFVSQTFSVAGGTTYQLSFDMLSTVDNRFNTATAFRVEVVTPTGTLISQSYTNAGRNSQPFVYQSYSIPFTVPAGVSSATLRFTDLSPNNGVAADPVLDNVKVLESCPNLLNNGSFEAGLNGWTVNDSFNIQTMPGTTMPPGTASDGTNLVQIGMYNVPGNILSQVFQVVPGTTYLLSFDILALGDPGRTSIVRVELNDSLGTLVSQLFTNAAKNTLPLPYESKAIPFTVPQGVTSLTLRFLDLSPNNGQAVDPVLDNIQVTGGCDKGPAMWFDTFELSAGGDPNYFLPEESLKRLIGENAKGDWKLEIWDNRAGAPLGALVNWQLHLTFASTNATATTVTNATQVTNTVAGGEIKYFIVDVPIFATHATNVLVSGGGGLNLLFNQDALPVGNPTLGDVTLLSSTVNGTALLTTTTFPDLRPGGRYYLGVQNANATQTNFFTFSVTFDDTNNLVNVTPLTNATPYSTTLPLSSKIQYYQYDLSNSVSSIEFKLFSLSGDADLVVRRDQLPTESVYDFNSNLGGTNDEIINVATPAIGRYYLGVYGYFPTNGITYSVMVTEAPAPFAPAFLGQATLSASGFHVTANTIIDREYQFDVSLDLVNWTTISTTTATANITTFTDSTPPATQAARFYRLKLLP